MNDEQRNEYVCPKCGLVFVEVAVRGPMQTMCPRCRVLLSDEQET